MIGGSGHRDLQIIQHREERTMLKTISAAVLAVSVLAAPALAAAGKNDEVRTVKMKASVLNANAKMDRHHTKHYRHTSHRHHKNVAAIKVAPKAGIKAPAHTIKRG
jgi:Ni/Co efflux regulator RcnB